MAVAEGFHRAWPSIRDSNFSTLITCIILFWFGNTFGAAMVKGFAITLAIGVLVSWFSAITVTRTFLTQLVNNGIMKGLTLYGGNMINIISKRYWFFLISALIIVPGLVSLIAKPHLNLGTDFQSGTAMTLQFDTDIQESALREALTTAGYQEATIQYSPSSKRIFCQYSCNYHRRVGSIGKRSSSVF